MTSRIQPPSTPERSVASAGPVQRRRRKNQVRLAALAPYKDELVVWWYGGIVRNNSERTIPLCVVFFRKLDAWGHLGEFVSHKLALTSLGLLRIGTVWREGRCDSEIVLNTRQFDLDLDFTSGQWDCISPHEEWHSTGAVLIPQHDYALRYSRDRNYLLRFVLKSGITVLIPCLEYLVRCYGQNKEIARVLATYQWAEVQERFFIPVGAQATDEVWPIKLTSRMRNWDTAFLAHLLYDEYTRRAARSVNAQIQAQFKNLDSVAFIKIWPWFEGAAQLRVQGLWIDGGKTLLVLRILGSSEPTGVSILRDRERPDRAELALIDDPALPMDGHRTRVMVNFPPIHVLTEEESPDNGSGLVEIEEDDFAILGQRREVIDRMKAGGEGNPLGRLVRIDGKEVLSPGDQQGAGKGVGSADILAPLAMESEGTLLDMWNALHYLKESQEGKSPFISNIDWYTSQDGFSSEPEPRLISLQPYGEDEEAGGGRRNWLFLNVERGKPRGILVIRVTTSEGRAYILEVQRRLKPQTDQHGVSHLVEEPLKGLVVATQDEKEFLKWLPEYLLGVRDQKGVVQNLLKNCPRPSDVFMHSSSQDDRVPCQTAAQNALDKAFS